jgi:hypothetical protein
MQLHLCIKIREIAKYFYKQMIRKFMSNNNIMTFMIVSHSLVSIVPMPITGE